MSMGGKTSTVAETDGLGSFRALQAASTSTWRARPPPMHLLTEQKDEARVPPNPSKVQRRESKGGLRSMFTRAKVEKSVISPVQEGPLPSGVSEQSMKDVAEHSLPRSISVNGTPPIPESTPITPAKLASKASRMNLRTRSLKQSKTPVPKPVSKGSPKSAAKPPIRTTAAWDPPPLFQAYPQAIKHAQLSASTLSADSIIRISNHKRNHSLRDEIAQTRGNNEGQDQSAAARKTEKAKSKHRRQISGSISKADWTQKTFVLVTSGYLLQYSGEGSFDRLPEKMMQLGKDSVAFASDVIPGKHWVLQISQSMDSDGVPASDSRSLLSRLAFRGADYRRSATSLLLVLNSAEEMDSWIAVVRREIEALGGKKHVSETGKSKPDDKVMQLRAQPSSPYLVQQNPDQFSNLNSPMSPSFVPPPWNPDGELQTKSDDSASLVRPQSSSIRPLTGHRSGANSITSHDGQPLDNLRDNTNRLSYMSSGQRTLITSQGSSAANSPTRESMSTLDDDPLKLSIEETSPRPNAYTINERRRSMQTVQNPLIEPHKMPFRPHSAFGPPRSYSPPTTPNFSVPTFSSKRYSTVKAPALEAPPIPTIVTTTPSKSMLKGSRKPPLLTLNVTRPLSPVTDSPSPKPAPPVYTPTESSFKKLEQVKASMIDIPPRSPSLPASPVETDPPRRFSSLTPLKSTETVHIDFQFPPQQSRIQTAENATEHLPDATLAPPPMPCAVLTLPLPASQFIGESEQPAPELEVEMKKQTLSPLSVLASANPKPRRPISMQIQTNTRSLSTLPPSFTAKSAKSPRFMASKRALVSAASSETLNHGAVSPAPSSMKSPSTQRLKAQASPKLLRNRRSMPTLVSGPPPAPPPDCALPPLPPGSGRLKNPLSLRNSVRV